MVNRTWQARLAMKQDIIRRKIQDNSISNAGVPIDCIRIKLKKNDEGDIVSRIIEKADVVSIVFPPLKDIPYRRLAGDLEHGYTLTSLVNSAAEDQAQNYEIYAPHNEVLTEDDLIIRIFQDPDTPMPIIVCLQVLEPLGTFGGAMLIGSKYKTNLYNENLNAETLHTIAEMAKRRLSLKF